MVRTGTRRPVVAVVAGTLLRDRAVLMADGVPMPGLEFPPTGSGVPAAAPLIIPSQIGEAQAGAGVIRNQLQRRRRACGRDQPVDRGELRPLNPSQMRSRSLRPIAHTERSPVQDTALAWGSWRPLGACGLAPPLCDNRRQVAVPMTTTPNLFRYRHRCVYAACFAAPEGSGRRRTRRTKDEIAIVDLTRL